jgi:hypothetical protein
MISFQKSEEELITYLEDIEAEAEEVKTQFDVEHKDIGGLEQNSEFFTEFEERITK